MLNYKEFKMKKIKAFSLVEILISLIVVSILLAAFVPVITKKMSKNIEIKAEVNNSGDDNDDDDGSPYKEPTSQADCDPYHALYISAHNNGPSGKGVCVTRYNAGDNYGPTLSSSAVVQNDFTECSADDGSCCWQGSIENPSNGNCTYTDGYGSTYSACSRTICEAPIAEKTCAEWAPSGMQKGMWRLPRYDEMSAWASVIGNENLNSHYINMYMGQDGLQLCDGYYTKYQGQVLLSGRQKCGIYNSSLRCTSSHGSYYCQFSYFWGEKNNASGDNNYYYYGNYSSGTLGIGSNDAAAAVRCVAEKVPKSRAAFVNDKKTMVKRTVSTTATTSRVEIPITSNIQKIVIKKFISKGGDGGDGNVSDSSFTTAPRSVEDCPEYSYYHSGGCYSKWNLGDTSFVPVKYRADFALPSTLQYTSGSTVTNLPLHQVEAGSSEIGSCSPTSSTSYYGTDSACCWVGQTAADGSYTETDSKPENPSTYSGQNRTVCTYQAADLLCQNWAPTGTSKGDWYLPSYSKSTSYSVPYSSSYNGGSDSWQLCGSTLSTSSYYYWVLCAPRENGCIGTSDKKCYPNTTWLQRGYYIQDFDSRNSLQDSSWFARSVRCVKGSISGKLAAGGGGGSSGAIGTENYEIDRIYWVWHVGGKLVLDRDYTISSSVSHQAHAAAIYIESKDGKFANGVALYAGTDGYDAGKPTKNDDDNYYGEAGTYTRCNRTSSSIEPAAGELFNYGGSMTLGSSTGWYNYISSDYKYPHCAAGSSSGYTGRISSSARGYGASLTAYGVTYSGGKGGTKESPDGQDGQGYGTGGGGGFANDTKVGVGGKGAIGYIEVEITESQ